MLPCTSKIAEGVVVILKQERIQLMEEYIARKGFASMEELCRTFSISINTARADVRELVRAGRAQKAYGGVSCEQAAGYPGHEIMPVDNAPAKVAIAKAAAQLVRDGDVIYIDIGTTCLLIVDSIPASYNVTIITNGLSAINRAAQRENTTIMTFGGTYKRRSNSFKCTFSALHAYINSCNISRAFLGTTGITAAGALTNSENFGREVRSSILKACPACYLLADSSKFGKTALLTYGHLEDLTACITDSDLPEDYRLLCKRGDTELIVAGVPSGHDAAGENPTWPKSGRHRATAAGRLSMERPARRYGT